MQKRLATVESVLQPADACLGHDACAGFVCPPQWRAAAVPHGYACTCSCRQELLSKTAPPSLLHQAWKTARLADLDEPLSTCVRSWRIVNPNLRQELYDDARAADFVRRHYPQHATLFFDNLTRTVERADVFRYLVVHHYGGWWADVDTIARRPLESLRGDLIVGREPQANEDGFGVAQYFFGATPRHPFFDEHLLPLVTRRVARRRDARGLASVLWATGPEAFTAAYRQYVRAQRAARGDPEWRGSRWDGDVLPTCALGAWCYDCAAHGFRPILEHLFLGSWKGDEWTKKQANSTACNRAVLVHGGLKGMRVEEATPTARAAARPLSLRLQRRNEDSE